MMLQYKNNSIYLALDEKYYSGMKYNNNKSSDNS